ncbi:SusD/RagB family nutrient-binding outer membrane lipoprotein [Fulvivirga maritima]|uniref:RagB/SusD family nutrient uptake outer membrane protein n=1 Tax=Fulvivirga maritima TaxID=2904247 RepID=UPI001F42C66D|nr:RagB/SusD family nutrient uptake outer membrane protein [Fulvivirga maritima]UII27682.1 SusD/RagB family nutrient-binding outer membrane lipoprotein [Fulvivirga maritima]
MCLYKTLKQYRYIWTCLMVVLVMSCTSSFDEINVNPHEATEEMLSHDNLRTGAFFSQMQHNVVLFDDGDNLSSDYQVSQGLSSDLYSGYMAPTGSWYNGVHNGSYYFITSWVESTFTSGFINLMPTWEYIVRISEEQGVSEVAALATVVKVEGMHRVADAYGPLPYLDFGTGSVQNDYDALEDIYIRFFEELDNAIDDLTNFVIGNPDATILADYDNIYDGNVTQWVRFANTLRLRLAMRVVYANPALAQEEAEKSINNPIGLLTEVNDRATLKHSADLTYYHPLYDIAYNFNSGEVRMSASMDAYMNGYNDPRRASYFTIANDGEYHGVRLGIETSSWTRYKNDEISNLNVNNSSTEIVWMTAAESYFLRAEGALRGWNMGGSAQELYEAGIRVSFEENNAGGVDEYISDDESVPIAFEDNAVGSDFNANAPSDITIAWDQSASFEENLERIITQKWIAIYPDGPEGWAEFRRTGYPRLIPVVNNNSNGTIDTEDQVRRIIYPQSEYINNQAGVMVGVSLLGGPDNGGTRLWWDNK